MAVVAEIKCPPIIWCPDAQPASGLLGHSDGAVLIQQHEIEALTGQVACGQKLQCILHGGAALE
jgi:hypothetical protein